MGNRWTRIGALTGVVFVASILAEVLVNGSSPSSSARASTIQHYYLTHKHNVSASGSLGILAVVLGIFFFGYLWAYFRRLPGNEWLTTTFFGGAIIFGVGGALGAGVDFTLTDSTKSLTPGAVQLLNTMTMDLNWPLICVGLGILYLAAGFIIFRSRVLPLWLAWVSWIFGLLAVSYVLSFIPFVGTALWVLFVSIRLAIQNPSLTPETEVDTRKSAVAMTA